MASLMRVNLNSISSNYTLLILFFLLINPICFAKTIVISSTAIIDKNTVYRNDHLDLKKGSFLIMNGASLTLEDCTIDEEISPTNPFFINVANGSLILKNNVLHVEVSNLLPNPLLPSLYYLIMISKGTANIIGNTFISKKPYVVGLFRTTRFPTDNIIIKNNHIFNFHGGILLNHAKAASITGNQFMHVSGGNIFIIEGKDILINKNNILFAGNNNVGDGIDISDSNNISVMYNYILAGSCYSLLILRGENILIHSNHIIGGITYGIFIDSALGKSSLTNIPVTDSKLNKNIIITNNYLSQNRYALSGKNIHGLTIKNNIIIQHFSDTNSRKFWTNNETLFRDVDNFTWENNFYKEAFSQEMNGNNEQSLKLIEFPFRDGVVL